MPLKRAGSDVGDVAVEDLVGVLGQLETVDHLYMTPYIAARLESALELAREFVEAAERQDEPPAASSRA